MLAVSMPNFVTSWALVDTATKCLAVPPCNSPFSPASSQSRAGVRVGYGLERGEGTGWK